MSREIHTCPECCEALGYLESIIMMDLRYPDVSNWWKVRHPFWWFWVKARRGHSQELLDEAGK